MTPLPLQPGQLRLEDLLALWRGAAMTLELDAARILASADAVAELVAAGQPAYGINTGFGKLAHHRIPDASLSALQVNLIRSHAAGVGAPLDGPVTRLLILLKAASLGRGASGVRLEVIERLLALLDAGLTPAIPCQGSVGASGDLAPLAHLTLVLMGEGEVVVEGATVPAAPALAAHGIPPLALGPKEGLALINGTQVSTALALQGLFLAERALAAAVVIGAMSVDAARGSDAPFDARIHALRGQPGQIDTATCYRELLAGSEIRASHLDLDERVQDPYSLRCQPQVLGACLDLIRQAASTLTREANAVTDNPLLLESERGWEAVSGGNFHAEPVAFAADTLALALAEIGSLAERRIALLIDAALSGLSPFLAAKPGLESGFMVAHVTAAALASENKHLANPASTDSLPTSANQEDHVSMATHAARRLTAMADNTLNILAIELLAASTGIEQHRPLRSAEGIEGVLAQLRERVAPRTADRAFHKDIAAARALIDTDQVGAAAASLLPSSQT